MNDLQTSPSAEVAGEFELGMMLGSRKAFAAVAGRCSAADVECMRRIRDNKLYTSRSATWEQFCPPYLGLSKAQANRFIRYLEEFGSDYFEVAQLAHVTPEQYRAIAPAIRDKNIHLNGQTIAIIPENADRVAAAVAELRRAAVVPEAPTPNENRLAALERRFDQVTADFRAFSGSGLSLAEKSQLGSVLSHVIRELERLRLERR